MSWLGLVLPLGRWLGTVRCWVRVSLGSGFTLGARVGIIVRVRISVMVRVSTTHNFKYNH